MKQSTYINESVSFSRSLWLSRVGLPVLFFQISFLSENNGLKENQCPGNDLFHNKKYKEDHHITFMLNYEVLSLEVDGEKGWAKFIRAIFHM